MRRYELMLLLRPDLEDDKLQSAVEKVTRAIVNAGGSLAKVSPWGKRRLAYDIKHFREASYFLIHFDIAPTEIRAHRARHADQRGDPASPRDGHRGALGR